MRLIGYLVVAVVLVPLVPILIVVVPVVWVGVLFLVIVNADVED